MRTNSTYYIVYQTASGNATDIWEIYTLVTKKEQDRNYTCRILWIGENDQNMAEKFVTNVHCKNGTEGL